MSTVIIFLIVIIFLVVIHELGHFFVAKSFGVRVDEFGIGYPPRARKLFTWKKTLFTLNWLPFGGFVRIFGENDAEKTADSFAHKSMGKRVLIIAAGIIANMVLAVVLYSISFGIGFLAAPEDFPGSVAVGETQMFVTGILPNGPASIAGIASGDVITNLATEADTVAPKAVEDVIGFVKEHGDAPITISVMRDNALLDIIVTPKANVVEGNPGIGVGLAEAATIRLPFFLAIKQGFIYTGKEFASIIHGLGMLIGSAFNGGGEVLTQVSGPVGIAKIAGEAYSFGMGSFLAFVALISVNLAVINLLPFPALDGGRLILELFAKDGKSRIPKRAVNIVNQGGFLILILLMLVVTYHDIFRLFK